MGGLSDATTEGDRGQGMLELGLFRKARGHRASLVAQLVKNLPAMQETQEMWVESLCWQDSLEEEIATHSSILA